MRYHIDTFDNHLILLHQENKFLVDTGSPVSISGGSEINVFGQGYEVSQHYLGFTIEELSKAIGCNLHTLIGGDILKNHKFHVDFENKQFSILESLSCEELEGVNIDLYMDIPIIEIGLGQDTIRGFLDTGAKISYLNSQYVDTLKPIDDREDFYPNFGRFNTLIYELPIKFNNKEVCLTFGVLPKTLEVALSMGGTKAIVGNEIFSYFSLIFDYSNKKIYFK